MRTAKINAIFCACVRGSTLTQQKQWRHSRCEQYELRNLMVKITSISSDRKIDYMAFLGGRTSGISISNHCAHRQAVKIRFNLLKPHFLATRYPPAEKKFPTAK